jgi:hypothetical protein
VGAFGCNPFVCPGHCLKTLHYCPVQSGGLRHVLCNEWNGYSEDVIRMSSFQGTYYHLNISGDLHQNNGIHPSCH